MTKWIVRICYTWPAVALGRVSLQLAIWSIKLNMRLLKHKADAIRSEPLRPYRPEL